MSKHAVAYVKGLHLPDPNTEQVFLLLAERTQSISWDAGQPWVMGLHGAAYTNPDNNAVTRPTSDAEIGDIQVFTMPGWDRFSTWGFEKVLGRRDLGHFYAQLYRNSDDHNATPRIWITPPNYIVTTIDELAEAIADAIAPYELVPPPAAVIKAWLEY